jgi:hypothetical protein
MTTTRKQAQRAVTRHEASDNVQMGLRVPRALRDELERLAFQNRRSLNGEAQLAMEQYVLRQRGRKDEP